MISAKDVRRMGAPLVLAGEVVKGFGRGSKMLGIPTANLPAEALGEKAGEVSTGIYAGWATVNGQGPYKAVLSIGWNPYFKNSVKTIEPHLLHEFPHDFYGEELRLVVCAFLRPEQDFPSLDSLVEAIRNDIAVADQTLEGEELHEFRDHPFLKADT